MSKVLGIVAEYNPFHNGHLYHLTKSKELCNAEFVIAIVGGNFTQRGEPSLMDKWAKTQTALSGGVDLVIELPVLYNISSAENFADGAIKILDSLKVVDDISFGVETEDINILEACAEVLYQEPKEFKSMLSHELDKGLSYPKARQNALMLYLNDIKKFANVLSHPNNILGIEYLKSLKKNKNSINPVPIKRSSTFHDDHNFSGYISSATAIRNSIMTNQAFNLNRFVPKYTLNVLREHINTGHAILGLKAFEKEIIYGLRKMSLEEIRNLQDVTEGLENSIKNAANSCNTLSELINMISSKRYTQTRIQRILLYSLLGVTKKDIQISKKTVPYARVLGFNERGKYLIAEIARVNPKINFITSVKRFVDTCPSKNLQTLLQKDILATNVYTLGFRRDSWANLDYTKKIVEI